MRNVTVKSEHYSFQFQKDDFYVSWRARLMEGQKIFLAKTEKKQELSRI